MKAWRLFLTLVLALTLFVGLAAPPAAAQAPMTWAVHITIAPTWRRA